MKGRSLILTLLLTAPLTGCALDGDKNEPRISNESGVPVSVFWTGPSGDEVHFEDIAPGQETGLYLYPHACAPNDMVAKSADGGELARTEKPLCPGDLWRIPPSR